MRKKHRLALVSVNNAYGENIYLPLTSGLLWASARMDSAVFEAYEEPIFLYKKERVVDALKALGDPLPDVVAFSCYIWNWEWNCSLAKAIKEKKHTTQIVFGGVHVPDSPAADWFSRFPAVDFLLHGEGEASFTSFLKEHCDRHDWLSIPGLSSRDFTTKRQFSPLEAVGSPYLDGVFDSLLLKERRWQVLQETNRGCPYSCTFCEWGASALNKIRPFPLERILREIDWFGANQIDYIDNADANFGILPRDEEIAEALIRAKERYGYPTKFRTSFAKYSSPAVAERVFRISKALNRAGQLKAVTLALQSTNSETMDLIKRRNIAMGDFSMWQQRYRSEGIPTYTELILGLPGESFGSFLDGIDQVLDSGQHEGIFIYLCTLLPNSEMAYPEYTARHGLISVRMRAMLTHGTPAQDVPDEWQDTIVATRAMPHEAWLRAYLVAWAIQVFHSCGLTTWWACEQRKTGIKYSAFYSTLIDRALENRTTVLWMALDHTCKLVEGALEGRPWTNVLPRFGEISWPPDEGGFLLVAADLELFYSEMEVLGMPSEQRMHGPPTIPAGLEKDYAKQVWYGRRGAFLKGLRDVVSLDQGYTS